MSERQYIGARYVPKFFQNSLGGSDWVANTAYEALTIVTRNGNSYTSRIPVPATVGAPESNPDYWVSTGIYNQQIEEIREEVDDVNESIENLVKSNANKLSVYKDKVMVVVGDSIPKGRYVTPEQAFPAVAANAMGMICKNFAQNSGGYIRSGAQQVLTQINAAIDDSTFDNEDVGMVLMAAGVNDVNDTPASITYYQAVYTAIGTVKNNFPNARIIVLDYVCGNMSLLCRNNPSASNVVFLSQQRAAILQGVECVDNAWCWGLGHDDWFISTGTSVYNDEVNADSWHPNAEGNQYYAYYFLQNVLGINYKPSMPFRNIGNANVVQDGGGTEEFSGIMCTNGMCKLGGRWNIVPPASIANNIYITLPSWAAKNAAQVTWVNAHVFDTDGGNERIKIPIQAQIASVAPSGQTQPQVQLILVAPSGGWKSTHVLCIPEFSYLIGL